MHFGRIRSGVATAVSAALLVTGLATASASAKTIRINYGHRADFASEIHTAAWILQKYVNENSPTLEVVLYPNSGLGQIVEVYEAMRLGAGASCQISGTAELNGFYDRLGVFDLPFLYRDYEHANAVFDGPAGETIAKEVKDAIGIEIVAWMDSWGYRHVITVDEPVSSVADLAGLKIRTLLSPIYVAALELMGASPTPMAYGEVYTAAQRGVIDGLEVTPSMVQSQRFYEVTKYITLTSHIFTPLILACSAQEMESLTDEERAVFEAGARLARDVQRALAPKREAEALEFLKEQGMVISEIDMSELLTRAPEMHAKFAEEAGAADLLEIIEKTQAE